MRKIVSIVSEDEKIRLKALANAKRQQQAIVNESDYYCDKCGILGNFLDGTMWGVGKGNMETCLCNECLENYKN